MALLGNQFIFKELRRRIVEQDLPPGTPLREQALAGEFQVSRARIRDTFGVLEERGLIERIPNRGAIVTRLEAQQIEELFEVREVLEAKAVRLATEKSPTRSWGDLINLFGDDMEQKIQDYNLDAYENAIYVFRQRCFISADNQLLNDLLNSLYDRTRVLIRRLILVPGRAETGMHQHRKILAAMQSGKAEKAERLKRQNIESARAWFFEYRKYLM
tara:strand:+ start:813 stop:1460 length:648 start_codon:yes stop_codon:yes gene_type:complete